MFAIKRRLHLQARMHFLCLRDLVPPPPPSPDDFRQVCFIYPYISGRRLTESNDGLKNPKLTLGQNARKKKRRKEVFGGLKQKLNVFNDKLRFCVS